MKLFRIISANFLLLLVMLISASFVYPGGELSQNLAVSTLSQTSSRLPTSSLTNGHVGNELPNEAQQDNEYLSTPSPTTDHDHANWDEYLDWLMATDLALTEAQHGSVVTLWKAVKDTNIGEPQADLVFDEEIYDEEVFRLFWKRGVHNLEIDIFATGNIDWFYMNLESAREECGEGPLTEDQINNISAVFTMMA